MVSFNPEILSQKYQIVLEKFSLKHHTFYKECTINPIIIISFHPAFFQLLIAATSFVIDCQLRAETGTDCSN